MIFIESCIDHGFLPQLKYCGSDSMDCMIVWNEDTGKLAFFGVMNDESGRECVVTYLVDMVRWDWAEAEGFTIEDIFLDDRLFDQVFTYIHGLHLAKELSS